MLLIAALTCGCGADRATEAILDRADSLMESRPDSSLALLDSIEFATIGSEAVKARYALLMSQARDKNYIDIADDSLISIATDYYADRPDSPELMKSLFYRAKILYNNKDYPSAIIMAIRANEMAEKLINHYWLAKSDEIIADIYSKTYYNDKEIEYRLRAASNYLQADRILNHRYALVDCAASLACNRIAPEKGLAILDSIAKEAQNDSNSLSLVSWISSIKVAILIDNSHYDKAQQLMQQSSYNNNTLEHYINQANIDIHNKQYNHAEYIIDSVRVLCSDRTDSLAIEILYSNLHEARGDYMNALIHNKSALEQQNFIVNDIIRQSVVSAERDFYNSRSEYTESRISKLYSLLLWGVVTLLISGIIILYIYKMKLKFKNLIISQKLDEITRISFYAQDNKRKLDKLNENLLSQKNKINELEKSLAQQQDKNKIIKQNAKNLFQERWKIINTLCDEFSKNHDSATAKSIIFHRVENEISTLSLPQNLKSIEIAVNKYMDNIVSKLRFQCPFIKEADIRFLTLIFAGFSPKAICILTEIKLKYFYTKKARLSERINNSNVADKNLFLNNIN